MFATTHGTIAPRLEGETPTPTPTPTPTIPPEPVTDPNLTAQLDHLVSNSDQSFVVLVAIALIVALTCGVLLVRALW